MGWWGLENALLYRWAYRAQAAADAAALAAAALYRDGRQAASDVAQQAAGSSSGPAGAIVIDVGDGTSGGEDLEFGTWDEETRTFTSDPTEGGEAVRITVRFAPGHPNGTPSMVLGRLFGLTGGVSITRRSTAVYVPPRHETSMLVTSPLGTTVVLQGESALTARGGASLATTSPDSVVIGADARMSVAVLRSAGSFSPQSRDAVDGAVEPGAAIAGDPFDGTPLPAIDAAAATPIVLDPDGPTVVAPGVHSGLFAGRGTIVLKPGLHQFVGPVSLQGTAALELDDATVQLDAGVALALGGSATVSGSPSDAVPGWTGVFLLSRGDLSSWSFDGECVVDVDGMIYVPGIDVSVQGAASLRPASAIVRTLTCTDSGSVDLGGEIEALETDPVPGRARLVR